MLMIAPISTFFDLIPFAVRILIFHAGMLEFRTGWFIESLVTQLLMIFAVRTRRNLFASRPCFLVTALALGISALTIALPFMPVGHWFGFVVPRAPYFAFLVAVVAGFLILTELVKRAFYARTSDAGSTGMLNHGRGSP